MPPATSPGAAGAAGHRSLRGWLRLLVVATVVALALNLVAAGALAVTLQRNITERTATNRSQQQLVELLTAVVEQGQRIERLALSPGPGVAQDVADGGDRALTRLAALARTLSDDPVAVAALDRAETTVRDWNRWSRQLVAAVERQDPAVPALAAGVEGQRLVEGVTAALADLEEAVSTRSEAGTRSARRAWQAMLVLLLASLTVTAVLAAVGTRFLSRSVSRPLARLVDDVEAVAGGDLHHRVSAGGVEELAALGAAVDGMRTRLLDERAVATRRSLLIGQEDERRRLAMGIHDDSVQAVLAASLRLQRLRRRLRDSGDEAVELVGEVQHDLEQAIGRLRRLVFELHPPTLDREGLEAAMRLYLDETLPPAGISWSLHREGELPGDPVGDALVYRLFREAVLNVLRHSRASRVDVRVTGTARAIEVAVDDDGVGFDPASQRPQPGHLGLLVGRQLCEATGGRWDVDSAPGRGARVRYTVPAPLA